MSLINNVLKELEDRPSAFTPLDLSIPARSQARRKSIPLLVVVIAIVLMLLAGLVVFDRQVLMQAFNKAESESVPVQMPDSVLSLDDKTDAMLQPVISESSMMVKEVNRITGLQISETGSSMELVFQFSKPAQSFLRKTAKGLYLFHIGDIKQAVAAPEIGQNEWLNGIYLEASEGGVDIRFETREGVLAETEQSSEGRGNWWLIRLSKPASAIRSSSDAEAAPESSVKKEPVAIAAGPGSVQRNEQLDTAKQQPIETVRTNESPAEEVRLRIRPAGVQLSDAQKLRRAESLIEAGALTEAEPILRRLVEGRQDRPARLRLISLLEAGKQYAQRDEQIQQGFARYPADPDFIRLQSGLLFQQKQYQALIERFANSEGDPDLYNLLASSYQRLGNHREAVSIYRKSLALDPVRPRQWVALGVSQQHLGKSRAALASYRMAKRSGLQGERLLQFVNRRIDSLSRQ